MLDDGDRDDSGDEDDMLKFYMEHLQLLKKIMISFRHRAAVPKRLKVGLFFHFFRS